jgi:hypothetical protein
VKHFTRQPDETWSYRLTTGRESSVSIPSIQCTLKLADVYDRVSFDAPQDAGDSQPPEEERTL